MSTLNRQKRRRGNETQSSDAEEDDDAVPEPSTKKQKGVQTRSATATKRRNANDEGTKSRVNVKKLTKPNEQTVAVKLEPTQDIKKTNLYFLGPAITASPPSPHQQQALSSPGTVTTLKGNRDQVESTPHLAISGNLPTELSSQHATGDSPEAIPTPTEHQADQKPLATIGTSDQGAFADTASSHTLSILRPMFQVRNL